MIRITTLCALALLSGCATLERHPVATAVIVGIAAGSIAASTGHRTPSHDVGIGGPNCNAHPESCL